MTLSSSSTSAVKDRKKQKNYSSAAVSEASVSAEAKAEATYRQLSPDESPAKVIALKAAKLAQDALEDLNAEESTTAIVPSSHQKRHEFKQRLHCIPVHLNTQPSPLSKEAEGASYRGFINLTILLLAVNMIRLVIENLNKYGVLISIPGKYVPLKDYTSAGMSLLIVLSAVFISWMAERLCLLRLSRGPGKPLMRIVAFFAAELMVVNLTLLLFLPAWIIWTHAYHPATGFITLMISLTLTMKLVSYHVVNYELRKLYSSPAQEDRETLKALYPDCVYPANLTIGNILYFWIAPTLCYQPHYPRFPLDRIRKTFLLKRLLELASVVVAMYVMMEQYAIPTVQNSLKPMNELNWAVLAERVLKLSTTSLYIWLLGFYALFHSLLNAFAEVLRFGDRGFYRDWWNARTIDEYWRLWNAPVHFWLKRHVYIPLRSRRFTPFQASLVIFALSAIGHEYIVAVATHLPNGWALSAMLAQIPLITVTKWYLAKYPNSSFGNYFFWVTFCILGMPMCVLFYYRSWMMKMMDSSVNIVSVE